jgi:hypothetical protein
MLMPEPARVAGLSHRDGSAVENDFTVRRVERRRRGLRMSVDFPAPFLPDEGRG